MKKMLLALLILLLLVHVGRSQETDLYGVGEGSLRAVIDDTGGNPVAIDFPLEHTDVHMEISGYLASVNVTQTFLNPYEDKIEAVYIFPLPQNAAVDSMTITVGATTIRGIIKEREEARQIYEEARDAGKRAGLLEQERPNVFTQSVANIQPGEKILVTIHYVEQLKYEDGEYEVAFPMVVGPRYIPEGVPDASRLNPPFLPPEQRSGHDISLSVDLKAGIPIRGINSRSHDIKIVSQGETTARLELESYDNIPNKDFMLTYEVAGEKPEFGLLTHAGEDGNFFTLMLQPKAQVGQYEVTPKEMIFVVDNSGSMSGYPMETAKAAMRHALNSMNSGDSFQIIRFSEAASSFSREPLENTEENIARGLQYVDEMSGMGGTRMLEGIRAALKPPRDPGRMRIVFFMTDGYIGNEDEILAAIEHHLGDARIFPLGVGTSVNRYLLDKMAEVGRGTVQYVRPDEDTTEVVEKFYKRIAKPYLTDISIDWGDLQVEEVFPGKIPDLFASQPVVLIGKYLPGSGTVTIRGNIAGRPYEAAIDAVLPETEQANLGLRPVWARKKVDVLMSKMFRMEIEELVGQITELGLEYSIMTKYTSFVAVEERAAEPGKPRTVYVPVEMPEMVSYEGVFGTRTAPGYGGAQVAMAISSSMQAPTPTAIEGGQVAPQPRQGIAPKTGQVVPQPRQGIAPKTGQVAPQPRQGVLSRAKSAAESTLGMISDQAMQSAGGSPKGAEGAVDQATTVAPTQTEDAFLWMALIISLVSLAIFVRVGRRAGI